MNEPERPSDPVSIDEMMQRLRNQRSDSSEAKSAESRETIIREDGSKVVRVRKRSRKKSSSKAEQSRNSNRSLFIFTLIFCLLALGGGFAFYLVQNARLNSGDYANKLLAHIKEATGAEGEIDGYQKKMSTIQAHRLSLQWPGQGIATSFVAQNLKGNIDGKSIFFGKLSGSELSAEKGQLILDPNPQHTGGPFGAPLEKSIPISKFRCNHLDVLLSGDKDKRFQLLGTSAELEFTGDSESRIFLENGSFESPILGSLHLSRGLLDFYNDRLNINNLILTVETGQIQLKGKLLNQNSGPGQLNFQTSQFPLLHLTQYKLEKIVNTTIDANNGVLDLGRDGSHWNIQLNGTAQGFNLTNLPVLSNIGILIDDSDLSATVFTVKTPIKLSASPTDIRVSELVHERKGVFKILFNCHLDKDLKLHGKIQVGISPRYVDREDFLAPEAFTTLTDGYRWASIDLSGNHLQASDNSSQKFNLTLESRKKLIKEQLNARKKRKALLNGDSTSNLESELDDEPTDDEPDLNPKDEPRSPAPEPSAGQRFDELTQ